MMIRNRVLFVLICVCPFIITSSLAQTIPVGIPVLENYYRRSQLLGEVDSSVSLTIRPIPAILVKKRDTVYHRADEPENKSLLYKSVFGVLPLIWQQQYNSHHPYGWNNGLMIPSKGYQTLVSVGVFANIGHLSIQLRPEFVFAENRPFKTFKSYFGGSDLPERFGNGTYTEAGWGQSSIRLNFGPVSFGLSNESLWWGPGIRNSLLMSNTAPGFKHLTLNTTRPVYTPAGSIEAQIIAGRLDGSGLTPGLPDDWRYLSGMAISYQPKWVPGLFLGITRSFESYSKEDKNFGDYFPLFMPFQKYKTREDYKRRDQLTSLYARWLFKNAKAEVYFEYGLNDHSYNLRDFLMSPEHSRAYLFGMRKLMAFKGKPDEFIQVSLELTRMEQTIDRIIRQAGEWYTHSQILHGYTHRGEVLGAGIGPGGDLQSIDFSWTKDLKQIGVQFERYVHNNDFYYYKISQGDDINAGQWVDVGVGMFADWDYKKLLFNTKVQATESINYQWMSGLFGRPKQNAFNLHASLGVTYRF